MLEKKISQRKNREDVLRLNMDTTNRLVAEQGLNNQLIANRLGNTRSAVSYWRRESGIPLDRARALAELLGVPVGDILSDETKALLTELLQTSTALLVAIPRELVVETIQHQQGGWPDDKANQRMLSAILDLLLSQIQG